MTRENFDKILLEEGVDDRQLRDDIWNSRPAGKLDEGKLRAAAKKFKKSLPVLRVQQELHCAIDRECNRE